MVRLPPAALTGKIPAMSELELYNYDLPAELIAQTPAARREESRLLVLNRATGKTRHQTIGDFPDLLRAGDCLVLNNTRVVCARLEGYREKTGGKWEGLFLKLRDGGQWEILGQTRGKLMVGEEIVVPGKSADISSLRLRLESRLEEGNWLVTPSDSRPAHEVLNQYGSLPLPPYIAREKITPDDLERYQTVFAQAPGSVAAPTAGLHFTPELLAACRERGVTLQYLTLHVGLGTFRPVTAERLEDHVMHSEWCSLSAECAATLRETKARGGRVVAVGTTAVRTLESAAQHNLELQAFEGETRLFIRPPYQFRVVDALLTNFHLPKSTLLILLATFAGRENVLNAYREAVTQRYRFFSYGDAMFVE